MTSKLRSASLLSAAAVFFFLLPAADSSGCGGDDVSIGDDGGGGAGSGGSGSAGGSVGPGCVITGCSGQICANEEMASTCEWTASYECYQLYGVCEQDQNGTCGWAATQDLQHCLDLVDACPGPDEPCMNGTNHEQCLDVATTCSGDLQILESCPLQFACSSGDRTPVSGACIKNSGDACTTDADCVSGGCGGELCYNPALGGGVSTCECGPAPYSCGCVNGSCTWWE